MFKTYLNPKPEVEEIICFIFIQKLAFPALSWLFGTVFASLVCNYLHSIIGTFCCSISFRFQVLLFIEHGYGWRNWETFAYFRGPPSLSMRSLSTQNFLTSIIKWKKEIFRLNRTRSHFYSLKFGKWFEIRQHLSWGKTATTYLSFFFKVKGFRRSTWNKREK